METTTFDLAPAADAVARVVAGMPDSALGDPTPCEDTTVAGVLDHLVGLTSAFARAAGKLPGGTATADPAALPADWRTRVPAQLDELVAAWRPGGRPTRGTARRRPEAWSCRPR